MRNSKIADFWENKGDDDNDPAADAAVFRVSFQGGRRTALHDIKYILADVMRADPGFNADHYKHIENWPLATRRDFFNRLKNYVDFITEQISTHTHMPDKYYLWGMLYVCGDAMNDPAAIHFGTIIDHVEVLVRDNIDHHSCNATHSELPLDHTSPSGYFWRSGQADDY